MQTAHSTNLAPHEGINHILNLVCALAVDAARSDNEWAHVIVRKGMWVWHDTIHVESTRLMLEGEGEHQSQ
jgi:hypothetical protein